MIGKAVRVYVSTYMYTCICIELNKFGVKYISTMYVIIRPITSKNFLLLSIFIIK